ncbi:MAG TPA: ribosome biogenesis GTPase Der [Alphaproteobacteria bacterium]|nr:ribosome biogenesis GTPase Der [Alphaproteobacteria bacterium]HAM48124.1 ribosome biogenesis GTPase Der [Alphaproteobacteria bacterium]HBA44188.1 ribosome biogenesis GTPase Der [Alphaproteobacteria bacterium]HCO91123.1 ribosome biogenesis GTPase Der [Alphaproteobacteria bacterium]
MMFTLAIVGRPNVGKSTLFNRLVGKRLALVDDTPGVTRDRREADARLADLSFRVIDTAGLEEPGDGDLQRRMREQTDRAIAQADICLLLIDARAGVTPLDTHFARLLRKGKTPILLAANKCEGGAGQQGLIDAYSLGIGEPIPLSAEHGQGLGELYDALADFQETHTATQIEGQQDEFTSADDMVDAEDAPDPTLKIAIVGRPNAGKSTLINQLIGEERLLAGPEAGLTRDSIAVEWEWSGKPVRLFDTAGMRKRARVSGKLEKLAVADAKRAMGFAEVAILLIDATMPFEKQDLHIADMIAREGRAMVIAVNKWDLIDYPQDWLKALRKRLDEALPQIRGVPLITLSALTGKGVDKLLPAVAKMHAIWNKRIGTAKLNEWLSGMTERHPPPLSQGRRIKLRYMTQVATRPPTFAVFSPKGQELPGAYARYLINGLRDDFDLPGVPIRLRMRRRSNPYVDE